MSSQIDPTLRTDEFDYELPQDLIAQEPLPERDASRLMVLDRPMGSISHHSFREFPDFLDSGDLVVANNTRVMHARLYAKRVPTGGKVELLILNKLPNGYWTALAKPAKRLKPGDQLQVDSDAEGRGSVLAVTVVSNLEVGMVVLQADSEADLGQLESGRVPLPPYITSPIPDPERYQTIYARNIGSAAAPTAGLHLTERTLRELQTREIGWADVTLHIGLDTFRPVTETFVSDHRIHREWCSVSDEAAASIAQTRRRGGRVVALGTTSARTLETAGQRWSNGNQRGFEAETSLFIAPGYEWIVVDAMLTNFHLPRSTLLMMVTSFAGRDLITSAYRAAVEERYRFYSFGDAMLIL